MVLLFPSSKTLKSNVSYSMCHRTLSALSTSNSSRLTSRDGSALFARGKAAQTWRLLPINFVKLNPPLAQSSINCSVRVIAFSGVGADFKRSSTYIEVVPKSIYRNGVKTSYIVICIFQQGRVS